MLNKSRSSLCRRIPEVGDPAEVFVKGWRSSDTLQRSKEYGYLGGKGAPW